MSNNHPRRREFLAREDAHENAIEGHLDEINREIRLGFAALEKYPKSVTVYGSSMSQPDEKRYRDAYSLCKRIVQETGYAIVNGGGPGIMEAASKGANEAGGKALGLRINLIRERTANPYNTESVEFTYFFTRKTMLSFAAEAYVFFPGGFGTFDELFTALTLIQTNKIPRVPVILFGSDFWTPFKKFIEEQMLGETRTIDLQDMNIFEITDDEKRVIEVIKKSPVSEWWKNIG